MIKVVLMFLIGEMCILGRADRGLQIQPVDLEKGKEGRGEKVERGEMA